MENKGRLLLRLVDTMGLRFSWVSESAVAKHLLLAGARPGGKDPHSEHSGKEQVTLGSESRVWVPAQGNGADLWR